MMHFYINDAKRKCLANEPFYYIVNLQSFFQIARHYDHKIISRCNCDKEVKTFDMEKEYKKFFKVKKGIMKKRKKNKQ